MYLFYVPDTADGWAAFPEDEARHCVQVLRRRQGDEVVWTDGRGHFFRGTLVETGKWCARARVVEQWPDPLRRPFRLHMAVAPTKQVDRYEWFLEKATELGVERITPLWCRRGVRRKLRTDRLSRILVAAMKQSFRACLPQLDEPMAFDEFVAHCLPKGAQHFLATCQPLPELHLRDAWTSGKDLVVLVGPEGDFTPEEQEAARAAGCMPVRLGRARLRTETAGVLVAALVALKS